MHLEKSLVSYWVKIGYRAQMKRAMLNATGPASSNVPE
jgi:hypothetical protein